jgi:carboxymethylenebutenolidase
MGETVSLVAADGHRLDAYRALPPAPERGAVVVVQEVFGVNAHIRDVCDGFAAAGYTALAPALFDRVRRGVELDYDEAGIAEGRELAAAIGWDDPVRDIGAAAAAMRPGGRVGAVGYCWGASWTWVAACRLDLACAACYYGRHIAQHLDEKPRCPVILHFGADDASIPPENVARVRAAFPALPVHVYAGAGHGFNCDRRKDFRREAASLARERTLALLEEHLR